MEGRDGDRARRQLADSTRPEKGTAMTRKDMIEELGEPKRYRVERDGDRDLAFRGWRIGEGSDGSGGTSGYAHDWNRGTDVRIYVTTGGNYVIYKRYWSCWQGERERHEAAIHRSSTAALAAMRRTDCDYERGLDRAEKEAWVEACGHYSGLDGQDVEQVDVEQVAA